MESGKGEGIKEGGSNEGRETGRKGRREEVLKG